MRCALPYILEKSQTMLRSVQPAEDQVKIADLDSGEVEPGYYARLGELLLDNDSTS